MKNKPSTRGSLHLPIDSQESPPSPKWNRTLGEKKGETVISGTKTDLRKELQSFSKNSELGDTRKNTANRTLQYGHSQK